MLLLRYHGKKLLVTPSFEFHPSAQFADGFPILHRQRPPFAVNRPSLPTTSSKTTPVIGVGHRRRYTAGCGIIRRIYPPVLSCQQFYISQMSMYSFTKISFTKKTCSLFFFYREFNITFFNIFVP